jgi:hypothetical protein
VLKSCAAALCVDTNPIAVAATIASAVIANDVLFICIRILYAKNVIILILWNNINKYIIVANCVIFFYV